MKFLSTLPLREPSLDHRGAPDTVSRLSHCISIAISRAYHDVRTSTYASRGTAMSRLLSACRFSTTSRSPPSPLRNCSSTAILPSLIGTSTTLAAIARRILSMTRRRRMSMRSTLPQPSPRLLLPLPHPRPTFRLLTAPMLMLTKSTTSCLRSSQSYLPSATIANSTSALAHLPRPS